MKKSSLILLGVVLAIGAIAESHPLGPGFVKGFGLNIVVDGKLSDPEVDSRIAVDSNYSLRIENRNMGVEASVRITLDGVTLIEGLTLPETDSISIGRQVAGPDGFGDLFKHLDSKAGVIEAEFTWTMLGKAFVETISIKVRK